jgi:hypothetical protein
MNLLFIDCIKNLNMFGMKFALVFVYLQASVLSCFSLFLNVDVLLEMFCIKR